jgi:hypothetical protein
MSSRVQLLDAFLLFDLVQVVDRSWRFFYFLEGLPVAEGEAALEIERAWEVERTVRVCFFNEMAVLLPFVAALLPRLLLLDYERTT